MWILGGLIWAQPAMADPKIGVVNMTQLLADSPRLKTAFDTLQKEMEPRRQELLAMQRAAQASPKDKNLQQSFGSQAIEFEASFSARRSQATLAATRSISEAIAKYATSEGFDLVGGLDPRFIRPPLEFNAEPIDITDRVQASILHPGAPLGTPPIDTGKLPRIKIAVVKALSVVSHTPEERAKLREYASRHGFGIVVDAVYFAKSQFTITDITADILALPP